nr:PKD domain-containing protein [bacterium]
MPGNRPILSIWSVLLFFLSVNSGLAAVRVLTPTDYLSVYSPIVFDAWQSREQYASIRWEFDDTTVLYGPMAEHRYSLPGHHLVLVETTAPDGKKFAEVVELDIGLIPAGVDLRVVGAEINDPPPTGDANGSISP